MSSTLPLLLSDPLPLRRSTELPQYRADAILPWVYGRVTLAPVPLDESGLEWLVADHAIAAISRVTSAGGAIDGWQLVQRIDPTGHAIAVLRLTQPPKDGKPLAVHALGRMHPDSGALLEHPADIAADVLRQAGWSVPLDAFADLRADYAALALGLVFDGETTLRDAIAAVIEPLGAVWSAAPLMARRAGSGQTVGILDALRVDNIEARSDSSGLATVARIRYARDWADGRPRAALTLAAPAAIERYGRIITDIDLPAVRTARDALAIGTARLQDLARPQWTVSATTQGRDEPWQLGDTLTLAHPHVPAGNAMITERALAHATGALTLSLSLLAGNAPRIDPLGAGGAIDATEAVQQVIYRDGVATFTITDDAGSPLAGASVTLDGIETRTTDRLGQVQFTTTRGPHSLLVVAHGFAPFEMGVVV